MHLPDDNLSLPVLASNADRLKAILAERPLYISIETTNVCNARCVFCAYPKLERAKGVMTADLFGKILGDYSDMGGGAVGLTPIVGDVLLDPLLLDRLRRLRSCASITHVSFTTNLIAWDRYSPADRRFILESVDCLRISLGGLDDESYHAMFAVDRYARVRAAIHDVCALKSRDDLPLAIHLGFRVNRPLDEVLDDPRMAEYRRPEVDSIAAANSFGNWGGIVGPQDLPAGATILNIEKSNEQLRLAKQNPCFVLYLDPEITTTGVVSACACMNAEVRDLVLGDVSRQHLRDIWTGPAMRKLRCSFGTDQLNDVCTKCISYEDGERFIRHPALRQFRLGDNPWEVLRAHPAPPEATALRHATDRLLESGNRRIALYGAGRFTRTALAQGRFDLGASGIVAVIDDDPLLLDSTLEGLPIVSRTQALALRLDAVVLASTWYLDELWRASQPLRDAGLKVVTLEPAGAEAAPVVRPA